MQATDRRAITETVQLYLDGLYEGDTDKLAKAFHPTSSLASEDKGVLTQVPREKWLEMVRGRQSGKSQGLTRHDEIIQIDQSSPTTAFVKLKCQLPPRYFTDYLVAMKLADGWQIVSKSYRYDLRE